MAAKGGGQRLDATADAEDGQLTVVGQSRDEQLGEIALGIDGAEQGGGLLTSPVGVIIAAATENETVDAVEGVEDDVLVGHGGYHKGYASCRHH